MAALQLSASPGTDSLRILYSDLPTDPPEASQTRIQVQNPRDSLADSKPAWEPIYSELTLFKERHFSVDKNWKIIEPVAGGRGRKTHPRTPTPPRPLALTFDPQAAALRALPLPPRLCPGNDQLRNISLSAGLYIRHTSAICHASWAPFITNSLLSIDVWHLGLSQRQVSFCICPWGFIKAVLGSI